MTPLGHLLMRQIAATGPLTIAEYMTTCLLHPDHGYYTTRDPLGRQGDFITAPEISQMFGELVGLSLAQAWLDRGAPDPVALVEFGPGRGTLLADALRATHHVPGFHAALTPWLIEASEPLKAQQAQTLAGYEPRWAGGLDDVPALPLLVIANEFFDALPIRQFVRDGDAWRERMVTRHNDALFFALGERTAPPDIASPEASFIEVSASARAMASQIGARIVQDGGVALIIDYGAWGTDGDTFQAVRDHTKEAPLDHPGFADLTAHVDFAALAAAAGCPTSHLTPQGVWLEHLGITARAQVLARKLAGAALQTHIAAHRRLTHPGEMGELFKVLALHDSAGPPPGLEPRSEPVAAR